MPELHVTHGGVTVAAIDEGSGPALLIVHPGATDASSWAPVARLLTDEFRVVRIRRPIYVPGAAIPADHSMASEAAHILAIAARLEPPIGLIGHSSGAVAALEAALRVPARFAAMLLYEPPVASRSLVAGPATLRARAALDAGDPVEAMRIHLRDIVKMPAEAVEAICSAPGVHAAFAATAAGQLADNDAIDALGVGLERYRALDLPITLVQGEVSPSHLRDRVADLAATLRNAHVVTLPGQGHLAHSMAPALLATAIRDLRRYLVP